MPRRRRRNEPDKRLDWRDPDMPVLRAMTTGMEEMTPEDETAYSQTVMQEKPGAKLAQRSRVQSRPRATTEETMSLVEETSGASDIAKGMPGPLELSRMHEAELKRCYKQYAVMGALIRQIMVGRWISLGGYPAQHAQVTDIKLKDGRPQVYGKLRGTRRPRLLCESFGSITIIEATKP